MSSQCRFGKVLNDDDLNELVESTKPKNTKKQEDWVIKLWAEWASSREAKDDENPPKDIGALNDNEIIEKWVPRFLCEARNSSGNEYTPTSLKCIASAVYRVMKIKFNYSGPSFLRKGTAVCRVIDAKLKQLKSSGIGMETKRSDCVTADDEKIFWEKEVFSMETSEGLLNAAFFYNGKVLALRGRSEHHDLKIEQFSFKKENDGKAYIEFWPLIRKNNQGTTKYSKIRSESIKQYDTEQPKSYYKIIQLYLNSLPVKNGPFYRRAIQGSGVIKFSLQVVGINTLGTMLKKVFNQAGISDDRTISNHGLRATAATTLFENGFSQRTISIRTGHQSSVVNNYIRDSTSTHLAISKCLEPIVGEIDSNQEDHVESKPEDDLSHNEKESNNASDLESPIVLEFSRGTKRLKVTM